MDNERMQASMEDVDSLEEKEKEVVANPEQAEAATEGQENQEAREEIAELMLTELDEHPELVDDLIEEVIAADPDPAITDEHRAHLKDEFTSVDAISADGGEGLGIPPAEVAKLDATAAKEAEVTTWGSLWRMSTPGMVATHVKEQFGDMKRFATGEDRNTKAFLRIGIRNCLPPGMSSAVCEMMMRDPEARKKFVRLAVKDTQNTIGVLKFAAPLAGPEAIPIAAGVDAVATGVGDKVLELLDSEGDVSHQDVIRAIHEGSGMNDPETRKKVMAIAAEKFQDKELTQAAVKSEAGSGLLADLGKYMADNPEVVGKVYDSWLKR